MLNYVIRKFEGDTTPGEPQGLKIYLQATREIDKHAKYFDTFSKAKEIIVHLISLGKNIVRDDSNSW